MNEKDCIDNFIVGFGFGVGRGAPGGITTTSIALSPVTMMVQDEGAIKFPTVFYRYNL